MANRTSTLPKKTQRNQKYTLRRRRLWHHKPSIAALVIAFAITVIGATSISIGSAAQEFAQWNVICGNNHFGADDPIVYPNQPGASHMHSFFGNSSTNAYTTTASLLAKSPSSCGRNMGSKDVSAYWVPALYKRNADGTSTRVGSDNQRMTIYYRRVGESGGPKVKPFPHGLRMIAGNPVATSPQSHTIVYWQCGAGGPEYDAIPPSCPNPSEPVRGDIMFPSCWDGKNLDSANHRSHMAYPATSGACPATHPVSLPQVNIELWYDGVAGGSSYYLSSGGVYSLHGDFFAAWDNQTQNALVDKCMNTPHDCADINLSDDGRTLFVPDYDPAPISIVLGAYTTSSPWDGTNLQTPTPKPTSTTTPTHSSHASPTATTNVSTGSPTPGSALAVTPSSANLSADEVAAQEQAAATVTAPSTKYATEATSLAETAQSVLLQRLGVIMVVGGLAIGFGGWFAYRYLRRGP